MLIDTNQIINLTDFRRQLSRIRAEAKKGRTFYISDKGEIEMIVSPFPKQNQGISDDLWQRMLDIQKKMAREAAGKKGWDSTAMIRKMRDEL